MKAFYKSMMVVLVAVFLSACKTTGNPMFSEQYSEALTGKSVWFAEDDSKMIEISGSTALVTSLYYEYFDMDYYDFDSEEEYYEAYEEFEQNYEQRVAYVNRVGNDGSLHIMKDGDTAFYTVGPFSHNATEMDVVFEGTATKYIKAPNLTPADFVGKWQDEYYEDSEYEERYFMTLRADSYDSENYYIDHERQEYEYYSDFDYPFEFSDGYKFNEDGYSYYIKSFKPKQKIEFIDSEGYSWEYYWFDQSEEIVPSYYKKIDYDGNYGCDCPCDASHAAEAAAEAIIIEE